jgi:hypothetical protein
VISKVFSKEVLSIDDLGYAILTGYGPASVSFAKKGASEFLVMLQGWVCQFNSQGQLLYWSFLSFPP